MFGLKVYTNGEPFASSIPESQCFMIHVLIIFAIMKGLVTLRCTNLNDFNVRLNNLLQNQQKVTTVRLAFTIQLWI